LAKKKEPEFKFDLGDKVKDHITGFAGIVTLRSQWLNNCNTYGVQPTELKDGAPQEREHFDEPQLAVVAENVASGSRSTGGPERHVPTACR
jgi:hypothetical protein